jgi:two-component system, chemotaxis family, protein-glutamate methylesterase/glutaminase
MSSRLINATCPECRGPLTEVRNGDVVEYECLVGHRYGPEALLHAHVETEERALWSAIVALEEAQNLVSAVSPHLPAPVRPTLEDQANKKNQQAAQVRDVVQKLSPFRTE